ncbi:MAG: carboxypeptidase-like regulatory domain-containing protein [Planctomycetaceae bacterium]
MHYSPFRDNTFAERYPQYADQTTYFLAADHNFRTDRDGRFRIPVIPGHGARAPRPTPIRTEPATGAERIELLASFISNANAPGQVPTLDHVVPSAFHSLVEINPAADAGEIAIDLPLDPGLSLELLFTDADGQPVTGVSIGGVFTMQGHQTDSDRATAVGLTDGSPVTVVARNGERKIGARIDITPTRDSGPQTIVLYPHTIVRGRLIDPQNSPITETQIEVRSDDAKGWANVDAQVGTNAKGEFTVELLAGDTYHLLARGEKYNYLAKDLAAKPGESIDLGDLVIDPQGENWKDAVPKRAPIVTNAATSAAVRQMESKPVKSGASSRQPGGVTEAVEVVVTNGAQAQEPVTDATSKADGREHAGTFSGRVTDSTGQPLSGATIWLAINSGAEEREPMLKEVATSDKNGRFQFTLDAELQGAIGDAASSWWVGSLLAVAPGHGFDWMPLGVFQDGGAQDSERDEMKAHLLKAVGKDRLESRLLVLRRADRPVRGQLFDLEGRPLANVAVRVEAVSQPDVRLLLQALQEKSKQRYYDAVNATGAAGSITREHAHRLYPPVTTDASGRFELMGIGDDQLASLTIHGAGVESQVINVIGRTMSPARLPHLDAYPGGAKEAYYGRDFSHAVGPSVPIVGVVKEADSGAPVPNTLIYVERLFAEGTSGAEGQLRLDTQHMRTTTDAEGRYRLDGLPPGKGHVLIARPPLAEPLLMAQQSVSLNAPGGSAQTVDIRIKRTFWIEGRVTDKHSGAAVPAYVDYLALESNPYTLDKHGLQQAFEIHRYRTDKEGRFRVPGLPGPGIAMVLAIGGRGYPREVGADTVPGYDKDSRYIPTNPVGYPLGNWNLIKPIDPPVDAASFTCDFELDGGQKAAGRVAGPDGAALRNFSALGEVVNVPFWKQHADGQFAVQGYDGVGPRLLFFKNVEETLVGKLRVEGAATPELVVTLEPAVRVTGRLIAQETGLPAERYSLYCESSSLGAFRIDDVYTGDDGRFEVKGLMAGLTYKISTANSMRFSSGKNDFTIDVTKTKPGDVVDLGDVRGGKVSN